MSDINYKERTQAPYVEPEMVNMTANNTKEVDAFDMFVMLIVLKIDLKPREFFRPLYPFERKERGIPEDLSPEATHMLVRYAGDSVRQHRHTLHMCVIDPLQAEKFKRARFLDKHLAKVGKS